MSWEKRVNGLQFQTTGSVSQYAVESLVWDPFWQTPFRKNSSDPEQVILHGAGKGFLAISENAGKNWEDRTAYLEQNGPPNSWSDSPAPTMNNAIIKQVHGDIHKLGRFCGIAQLATGTTTDARGWLLVTDNDWFDTAWHPLSIVIANPVEWEIAPDPNTPTGLLGSGTVDNTGKQFTISSVQATTSPFFHNVALCVRLYSDQVLSCGWSVPCYNVVAHGGQVTLASASTTNFQEIRGIRAFEANCGGAPAGGNPFGNLPSTETGAQYVHWARTTAQGGPFTMTFAIDELPELCGSEVLPVSPLALDVDNETGGRAFVTAWENGNLVLQNWDVTTTSPSLNSSTNLGSATISEVEQKTYYLVPFCLADFSVSGFGDVVFVFGHFPDGSHIKKSSDGGATFGSNLGDGSWGTDRVSAFIALDENTWLAWLKTGTSQCDLWRTTTGGASWVKIQSALPVAPEHQAISRHQSGRLLIANSDPGPVQAVLLDGDYTGQYQDATGPQSGSRLPGAGDGGGGVSSIIWI